MSEQIIINSGGGTATTHSNVLQTVSCGTYFERFIDSQKQSEKKPHGMTVEGVVTFREETTLIFYHTAIPTMP